MAQAVKRLWPKTKLAIGPSIEEGFYYDLDLPEPIAEDNLAAIEAEMAKVIQEDFSFKRSSMKKAEAEKFFQERNEPFKLELIRDIPGDEVSIYTDGDFIDLCEGPHAKSTGHIKAFKLLSIAGAYWRGSERNPMLTRIYGTAFSDPKELDQFLKLREEAKRRDHRKLGTSLKLFSIMEEAGAGLVFYHPKGACLRDVIENYAREQHRARGYVPVGTPHLLKSDIWVRSGHYDHYKANMYIFETDNQEWGVKPMNCPAHMLIYESDLKSYRDLPLRFFELGTVYRNEKSGVLHGLLRVRGFTQDDAHIFCRESQLASELEGVLDFIKATMKDFGFDDYRVELSTRPPEFLGNQDQWSRAEEILTGVLDAQKVPYELSPGAGAFYGPKIDVHVKDSLGRYWQCATAQLDYVLPERFKLKYIEADGKEAMPVMIHRALFGSFERFMGMLIEHHAGAFPIWLAPVQIQVIPITEEQQAYAQDLVTQFFKAGLRVELDNRRETLQARIRDAQLAKVPYMLIIGKREVEAQKISVRGRTAGDLGSMDLKTFVDRVDREIRQKQ